MDYGWSLPNLNDHMTIIYLKKFDDHMPWQKEDIITNFILSLDLILNGINIAGIKLVSNSLSFTLTSSCPTFILDAIEIDFSDYLVYFIVFYFYYVFFHVCRLFSISIMCSFYHVFFHFLHVCFDFN